MEENKNNSLVVYCLAVDCQYLYYNCPFEQNTIHYHGNDSGNLLNRSDDVRGGHCPVCPGNVSLNVHNSTRRCGMRCDSRGRWKFDKHSEVMLKRIHAKQLR